jgi:hypothetical protein
MIKFRTLKFFTASLSLGIFIVSCRPGTYTKNLSGGYTYDDIGPDIINTFMTSPVFVATNTKNIYGRVIDFCYDNNFILVKQKPDYNRYKDMVSFEYRLANRQDSNAIEKSLIITDSLLKNDPYYKAIFSKDINYWIINNKEKKLLGPFTKEEYLKQRKLLNIPKSLAL